MRYAVIVAAILLGFPLPGRADPSISIGINLPVYPQLVRVPGYPVYYAPRVAVNMFFYDGVYWVYQDDAWYASSWYNGPWNFVAPRFVPVYVLSVPVRYYRAPPPYFHGWPMDAPPRWDRRWGQDWERQREDWPHRYSRVRVPAPAPLPIYQRDYAGHRYPQPDMQAEIRERYYGYRPSDPVARRQYADNRGYPGHSGKGAKKKDHSRGADHRGDRD